MMNVSLVHIQIDADADKRETVDAHNLITLRYHTGDT